MDTLFQMWSRKCQILLFDLLLTLLLIISWACLAAFAAKVHGYFGFILSSRMTPRSFSTAAFMPVSPTSAAWAYFFADVRSFICFCWTCWFFCHLFLQLLVCSGPSEEQLCSVSASPQTWCVHVLADSVLHPIIPGWESLNILVLLLIPKGRISTTICFMVYETWDYDPGAALRLVCWCLFESCLWNVLLFPSYNQENSRSRRSMTSQMSCKDL